MYNKNTNTMTNLSEKFLSNLIQRGYNYVDSGFCVWADWKQEMSSFLHASNNDLLDLSETDINDIIQFVWNQSYTIEKKEKKYLNGLLSRIRKLSIKRKCAIVSIVYLRRLKTIVKANSLKNF